MDQISQEDRDFLVKELGFDPIDELSLNGGEVSYSRKFPFRMNLDKVEVLQLEVGFSDIGQPSYFLGSIDSGIELKVYSPNYADYEDFEFFANQILKISPRLRQAFVHLQKVLEWTPAIELRMRSTSICAVYLFCFLKSLLQGLFECSPGEIYDQPFEGGIFYPERVFSLPDFFDFDEILGTEYFEKIVEPLHLTFCEKLVKHAPLGWLTHRWREVADHLRVESWLGDSGQFFTRLSRSTQKRLFHVIRKNYKDLDWRELEWPGITVIPVYWEILGRIGAFRYEKVIQTTGSETGDSSPVKIAVRLDTASDPYKCEYEFMVSDNVNQKSVDLFRFNMLLHWKGKLPRGWKFQLMIHYAEALAKLSPEVLIRTNTLLLEESKAIAHGSRHLDGDPYFLCLKQEDESAAAQFCQHFLADLERLAPEEWWQTKYNLLSRLYFSYWESV